MSSQEIARKHLAEQADELEFLLERINPMLTEHLRTCADDDTPVVTFKSPKELMDVFDLELSDDSSTPDEMLEEFQRILSNSVRTPHPRFFDKLFGGTDAIGQVGELLTAAVNNNVHTYAVSPVVALMEVKVIKTIARCIGYMEATAEGSLVPGGSFANMMAMVVARHHLFPHVRREGWRPTDRPCVLCSAQAHYSVRRACMMLGIGMDNAIPVKADINGRMIPDELEAAIISAKEQGMTPLFVSCTAGTTVMGGFDRFTEVHDICKRHNLWMHIDAAWGGTAIMSSKLKPLVKGVELSDSFTWDAHKGYGMPIFASAVIINNHPGLMRASNNSSAEYLFHQHDDASYDLGDISLQCGRRADSLKIWLSFRRHGLNAYEKRIDNAVALAKHMVDLVKKDDRFVLVAEPQFTNVCFWYVPPCLRQNIKDLSLEGCRPIFEELDKVTNSVYRAMQAEGKMLVNFNPLPDHGLPRFFRLVLNQPQVGLEDMSFVLQEIDRLGRSLTVEDLQ